MSTAEKEFSALLLACAEISGHFPQGVVFIGGIAVYLHAVNHPETAGLAEFTHDADFYISLADMSDLRDIEELTPNRRLNKHQLIKRGFDFDVYTERHSALIVPYDQVIANAVSYDEIKVACLEHLLVLKLEAYRDRQHSAKGLKDAKDIIRLAIISSLDEKLGFRGEMAAPYLSDEHLGLLQQIERGAIAIQLAKGNSQLTKKFRRQFSVLVREQERLNKSD